MQKTKASRDEEELLLLEKKFAEAAGRGDAAAFERYLAPGFFAIDARGNELSAADVLARMRTPGYVVESLRHNNARLRASGECAVVTAQTTLRAKFQDLDVSGEYPYLRVWQKTAKGWQAVIAVGYPPKPKTPAEIAAENEREVAAVTRLEREVGEAITRRDGARLRELVAEDFVAVNPMGRRMTREEAIAESTSATYELESLMNDEIRVRIFGDVALATARGTAKGRYQGKDASAQFTYLRVWARRASKWQAVAAQATLAQTKE
jgi:ketosteroid isomerase-like protein